MQKMRKLLFKICKRIRRKWYSRLSTLKPEGRANIQHPVLFEGKGRVIIGSNVTFGYFPSNGFFSGYTHIEARNSDAIIRIGNNNHFNNNPENITTTKVGQNCNIIESGQANEYETPHLNYYPHQIDNNQSEIYDNIHTTNQEEQNYMRLSTQSQNLQNISKSSN